MLNNFLSIRASHGICELYKGKASPGTNADLPFLKGG